MPSKRSGDSGAVLLSNAVSPGLCGEACACCTRPSSATQTLEELEFLRSAGAAAHQGDVVKLASILDKHPAAVHEDGTSGGSGYTPLHYAAREGHLKVVQLLLKRGAKPNAATRLGGSTPLHRAAYMGHLSVARELLAAGAEAGLQDADGETPLHKAASQGHVQLFQMLSEHCPEALLQRDRRGMTPQERLRPTPGRA